MAANTASPRMQFLAPSTAHQEKPLLPASDCGEATMSRLRHPFAVAATSAPANPRPAITA